MDDYTYTQAQLEDVANIFKVLSDQTRLRIIYSLLNQERCVNHLAEDVGLSASAVSHQLRTLRQAKLVRARRQGKMAIYSLDDDHVYTLIKVAIEHVSEDH